MMKLNNKGITTVEVIICFVLITIISLSLYSTVSNYNSKRIIESNKAVVYAYKNSMTKMIQDDFIKRGLTHATYTKEISRTKQVHTLDCDLSDGTKRKLIVEIVYGFSDYHRGDTTKDDSYIIKYGDPDKDEVIEYPLPNIGEFKNSNNKTIYDLSINNVMINIKDDNVLSLYIGFYHPELTTRYGIDIVCPIDYISKGSDGTNKFNVSDVQVKSVSYRFESNGGTGDVPITKAQLGDTLKLPSSGFKKTGYKLAGWNTREDGRGIGYALGENVNVPAASAVDTTLYAVWKKVDENSEFGLTKRVEVVEIEETGLYSLEVWGASGGAATYNQDHSSHGGLGGYAKGEIRLTKGDKLYVVVGEGGAYRSGTNAYSGPEATYNGGGSAGNSASGSGGGATHIAKVSGLLKDLSGQKDKILIVAGGGGGADNSGGSNPVGSSDDGSGGSGGGEIGLPARLDGVLMNKGIFPATNVNGGGSGMGGTQSAGFQFGKGENVTVNTDTGGAGGGFFGGLVTNHNNGGAGGGSGYLNPALSNAKMYCYGCSNTTSTQGVSDYSLEPTPRKAKQGNGYAIIKYISD